MGKVLNFSELRQRSAGTASQDNKFPSVEM